MRDLDPTPSTEHVDLTIPYKSEEEEKARYQHVIERDLFPYESDEFLLRRLGGSNRILRHTPEFRDQIPAALSADDDESLIKLAGDIDIARYLYTPEGEKPVNTIFSYITLLAAIGNHATAIEGADARWNALTALITKKFTDSFDEDKLEEVTDTIYYLSQRTEQIRANVQGVPLETIKAELLSLAGNIYKRIYSRRYIEMLPEDSGEPVTEEQARLDTEHIAELFTDIRATQSYGVKMGYIRDPRGGTLIFNPPIPPEEALVHVKSRHPLMLEDHSVADITHSRKKQHSRIKVTSTEVVRGLSVVGSTDDVDPIVIMSLGQDGELYTDRDCRTPFVDMARAKGKYTAYRAIQATILAHYFDMTHPLDQVRRAQQVSRDLHANTSTPPELPMESIARLVIPRTRFHSAQTTPITSPQEDRPMRSVRQHDVVWHVRELPEGWRASPSALELARKLGVTLEANETIVKEHKRGSRLLGVITAHELVQRQDKETSEE